MRRRAISSRTVSATCRLCSAESCLSDVVIVSPARFRTQCSRRTFPYKTAQSRQPAVGAGADGCRTLPIVLLGGDRALPNNGGGWSHHSGAPNASLSRREDRKPTEPAAHRAAAAG